MRDTRETASELLEIMRPLWALAGTYRVPAVVRETLLDALLELPDLDMARRCVADLVESCDALPVPRDIHAWRRAHAPRERDCPLCGGTGNVAGETIETERLGPQLVFRRCECTKQARRSA